MQTYHVETDRGMIELELSRDGTGAIVGHAYFRQDDMGADIVNGEFAHPFHALNYRVIGPTTFPTGKATDFDVILEINVWQTAGRGKPV